MHLPTATRDRIARLTTLIQSEAYFAIGRDRRFLATERRRARGAARSAMVVVIGASLVDMAAFGSTHGDSGPIIVTLNLVVALWALTGLAWLRGPGDRYPETVVFLVSIAIVSGCVVLGVVGAELGILAGGYLLILPPIVTLVVPSRPWAHVIWLLFYSLGAYAFLILAPATSLTYPERIDLAVLLFVVIGASFAGSTLSFRSRAGAYMQLVAMKRLRLEAETHRRALSAAQADLQRVVRMDQLTQVGNRLRLVEDLAIVRGRLDRRDEPFGLLEVDLDHFKAINDRFGHLVGDTVLHDVADIFKQASRADDTVYRFGGEEFVVLLPGADMAATTAVGERLRAAVEAALIENPGNGATGWLTVSVGGTAVGPDELGQSDAIWLERVDRALYQAKTDGRNRVVIEAPAA